MAQGLVDHNRVKEALRSVPYEDLEDRGYAQYKAPRAGAYIAKVVDDERPD
ncbi:MAG TPA: hypothetical protein VEJ84_18110 [Acidimicrobiales bacterium]|nr:hypothetical protein [Acidimicrobiales bacterium]